MHFAGVTGILFGLVPALGMFRAAPVLGMTGASAAPLFIKRIAAAADTSNRLLDGCSGRGRLDGDAQWLGT